MEHTADEVIDLLKKILPSAKPLVEPMAGAFLVALVRPLDFGKPPDATQIFERIKAKNKAIADAIWQRKIRFFRDAEEVYDRSAELFVGLNREHLYDLDVRVHALHAGVLLYEAPQFRKTQKLTKTFCHVRPPSSREPATNNVTYARLRLEGTHFEVTKEVDRSNSGFWIVHVRPLAYLATPFP